MSLGTQTESRKTRQKDWRIAFIYVGLVMINATFYNMVQINVENEFTLAPVDIMYLM